MSIDTTIPSATDSFYNSEAYYLTIEQYGEIPVGTVIVEANYNNVQPGHCPNCHKSAKLTSWGFCGRCTRRKHLR